jgi:hypothetical protein
LQITDIDKFTFNGELRVLSKNWCRLNITDSVKRAKVKNQTVPLNYIYIKPYLRSMSSMTEDEKKEYRKTQITKWIKSVDCTNGGYYVHRDTLKTFDWLNKHHFDYRGLIEKGLALEAPEGMYNY